MISIKCDKAWNNNKRERERNRQTKIYIPNKSNNKPGKKTLNNKKMSHSSTAATTTTATTSDNSSDSASHANKKSTKSEIEIIDQKMVKCINDINYYKQKIQSKHTRNFLAITIFEPNRVQFSINSIISLKLSIFKP